MLVLEGAVPTIRNYKYIKTEVADFEAYTGCCQLSDIEAFMSKHGFVEHIRRAFARRPEGGSCYDIVYRSDA